MILLLIKLNLILLVLLWCYRILIEISSLSLFVLALPLIFLSDAGAALFTISVVVVEFSGPSLLKGPYLFESDC